MFKAILKNLTLGLCLGLTLSSPLLAESGKDVGSGGGGLTINGKSYTFAELGIKPQEDGVTPYSNEVLDEIYRLLDPKVTGLKRAQALIVEGILNVDKKYINVDIVDGRKFKKILKDYQRVLGDQFDSKQFQVFAITNDKATYLFPSFYNLEVSQQAGIYIHEGFFRNDPKASLKNVLNFDYQLKTFHDQRAKNKETKNNDLLFAAFELSTQKSMYIYQFELAQQIIANSSTKDWWLFDTDQVETGKDLPIPPLDQAVQAYSHFKVHWGFTYKVDFFMMGNESKSFTPKELRYISEFKYYETKDCQPIYTKKSVKSGSLYVSLKKMKTVYYAYTNMNYTCDLVLR